MLSVLEIELSATRDSRNFVARSSMCPFGEPYCLSSSRRIAAASFPAAFACCRAK